MKKGNTIELEKVHSSVSAFIWKTSFGHYQKIKSSFVISMAQRNLSRCVF